MNPRTELEKRYPSADFSVYFRFLSEHKTEKDWNTQEHHICPRKQFPEFISATENVITLHTDSHALAHRLLEAACGIKAPRTALLEAQVLSASCAGKIGGKASQITHKKNRTGVYALTLEQRQENGRKGGSQAGRWKGHTKRVRGVAGAHLTHEHQVAAGRKAAGAGAKLVNHIRWHVRRDIVNPRCSLCTLTP